MVRRFAKQEDKKKKKLPRAVPIAPVEYDNVKRENNTTQTPITSLPASFVPAPFGYQNNAPTGSLRSFTKRAEEKVEENEKVEYYSKEFRMRVLPELDRLRDSGNKKEFEKLLKSVQKKPDLTEWEREFVRFEIAFLPHFEEVYERGKANEEREKQQVNEVFSIQNVSYLPQEPAPLVKQDFYDFYAACLSVNLLSRAREGVVRKITNTMEKFALKLCAHLKWFLYMWNLDDLNSNKKSDRELLEKIREGTITTVEHMRLTDSSADKRIVKAIQKIEAMIPVTQANANDFMVFTDNLVDIAHNEGRMFGERIRISDEKWSQLALSVIDEKSYWDEEFFRVHSPQLYNIYQQLKQYQTGSLRSFTKISVRQRVDPAIEKEPKTLEQLYRPALEAYEKGDTSPEVMNAVQMYIELSKQDAIRSLKQKAQVSPGSLLSPGTQSLIDSPRVEIEPAIKAEIQDAVEQLMASDPGYFKGVSKIVALHSGPYGQVSSDDPSIIHLNVERIKNDVKQQLGSFNFNDAEHREMFEQAIKQAIIEVVSHEKGHVLDYDPEQGFPGGEGVAEQESRKMIQRLFPQGASKNFCKKALNEPEDNKSVVDVNTEGNSEQDEKKEEYIAEWRKSQSQIEPIIKEIVTLIKQRGLNDLGKIVKEYQEKYPNLASLILPYILHNNDIMNEFKKYNPTLDNIPTTTQEFYDFYAAASVVNQVGLQLMRPAAERKIVDTIKQFTRKLLLNIRRLVWQQQRLFESNEAIEKMQQTYGSITNVLNKIKDETLPIYEYAKVIPDSEEGGVWKKIAEETAKLESMLPITTANIQAVIMQVDHIIDMVHHRGSIFGYFIPLVNTETGETYDIDPDWAFGSEERISTHEAIDTFLKDKTNKWDWEFFKTHSPQIYNIYQQLRQYTADIRGFVIKTARDTGIATPKALFRDFMKFWMQYRAQLIQGYVAEGEDPNKADWANIFVDTWEDRTDKIQVMLQEEGWDEQQIANFIEQLDEFAHAQLEKYEKFGKIKSLCKYAQEEKPTIGIDIDDTIANLREVYMEEVQKYIPLELKDLFTYRMEEFAHGSPELRDKVLRDIRKDTLSPIPQAIEKINELYDKGYRIVLITARNEYWRTETETWLKAVGLKYHKLILTSNKGVVAKAEGVDIFIDDDPKNLTDVEQHGVSGLLYSQPWNQAADMPRMKWKDIEGKGIRSFTKTAQETLTYGIDIDGTIADLKGLLIEIASKYIPIEDEDKETYKVKDFVHGSQELQDKVFTELYEQGRLIDVKPLPNAVEKINELYDKGNKIVIITKRPENWQKQTKEWLDKNRVKYHNIIFTAEKGKAAKEEGVDIFIDDDIKNIEDVKQEGIPAYLFSQPWNEDETESHVMTDWKEVKAFCKKAQQTLQKGDRVQLINDPERGVLEITGLIKQQRDLTYYQVEYHLTAEEQKERMQYWNQAEHIDPNPVTYQWVPEDQLVKVEELKANVKNFCKKAQYSGDTVKEWQAAIQRMQKEHAGDLGELGFIDFRPLSIRHEIPSLWQEILLRAYQIGGEAGVKKLQALEDDDNYGTIIRCSVYFEDQEFSLPSGGLESANRISLAIDGRSILQGNIADVLHLDSIVKHEYEHILQYLLIEDPEKFWESSQSEYSGPSDYLFSPAEKPALYAEVQQVVESFLTQGYPQDLILDKVKEVIYRRGDEYRSQELDKHLEQIVTQIMSEFTEMRNANTKSFCKKAQTDEMQQFFDKRTTKHINLVNEYLDKLRKHYDYDFKDEHDESKWNDPEHDAYVYITWDYKKKADKEDYEIPDEWKDKCDEASWHHVKTNKHHPEHWDETLTESPINEEDRDESSGVVVDATKMPDEHVLEMVADWCAMSEELGKNTPKEWADDNIGKRWKFSDVQKDLIYEAIGKVWGEEKEASTKSFCKIAQYSNEQRGWILNGKVYLIPNNIAEHMDYIAADEQFAKALGVTAEEVQDAYPDGATGGFEPESEGLTSLFDKMKNKMADGSLVRAYASAGMYAFEGRFNTQNLKLIQDFINEYSRGRFEVCWDAPESTNVALSSGWPYNEFMSAQSVQDLKQKSRSYASVRGFTKYSSPRWTTEEKNRLKELYLKYRQRKIPHHIIYKACAILLSKTFLSIKQKLESMYDIDEELRPMKFEHWDKEKIDKMIQDLYQNGKPINRLRLPANLMYQITNHSLPKAKTCGFPVFYPSFDEAVACNILAVGFERENGKITDKAIKTLQDAIKYYHRKEKMTHAWTKDEIVSLLQDAHAAGLPLTYSFFKSHPNIYKPLIEVGRSLEGLRDSIRRNGYDWSELVIEAVPEYVEFYTEDGKLKSSTEEMRVRRFLELNNIPFRTTIDSDRIPVTDPALIEMGYKHFLPDFILLNSDGTIKGIVEVFGSIADSAASNTSDIYREKRKAKEAFYLTLPYQFVSINNNTDGVDLTDEILKAKFATFMGV